MPITRSASGATARKTAWNTAQPTAFSEPTKGSKRKSSSTKGAQTPRKKAKSEDAVIASGTIAALTPIPAAGDEQALVPAVLTFSFEHAKEHLIRVDRRFEDVFQRLKCKPFEHLERVDPFRTLAHSIMGQQISWMAARSITHRFIRLFDPSLPEKPQDHSHATAFFPTAHQVASMDVATLRTAGLSGRKAEYVLDLASRFADGRLSTAKLLEADDEELHSMLTEVRGIGRWTVDMFAIFSLRRPDILPVGDLGVQRGVLRWFLSLHAPSTLALTISPAKLPKNPEEEEPNESVDALVVNGDASTSNDLRHTTPDISAVPPAPTALPVTPVKKNNGKGKNRGPADADEVDSVLPAPFTPSINRVLNMNAYGNGAAGAAAPPSPLPDGLTPAIMKSRLDGKKKIKGALLTPKEMEELTAGWRPYRSLGVYYMWALAEAPN
ncbi:DNA glycosylase [Laetiporus sulphureus 93-53]|uniref:DNA glycosylase n=1 Tax=Laetiporus sulphureus 93-53 TaxID=1314785 RepID=A0A165GPU4_9APHY|nr:DNA glycosylase [Laetiporus sulphureus 93-53]KZT10642.1 DNA glycosylase [Laetiporus sulphureus 93-53]